MNKVVNNQDVFLNAVRKNNMITTITTLAGATLTGKICAFDNYIILIEVAGKTNMVYKHAISTVIPQDKLAYHELMKNSKG